METSDMLLEIKTSRMSMVQYCHACPTSNLLAIAFSNYAVEVRFVRFRSVVFSSGSQLSAVVVFQLWDLEANKKMADCSGHLSWVQRVQFSHDGSQLLSCSDDQTVRVSLSDSEHIGAFDEICVMTSYNLKFDCHFID